MTTRTRWASGLLILTVTTACEDRQRAAELEGLRQRQMALEQQLTAAETSIAQHASRLRDAQAQVEEHHRLTKEYMSSHTMAVASLMASYEGGRGALDPGNGFSQDAREIAAFVGVVGVIWAIANAEEVAEVLETLQQADVRLKQLQAAAAETQADHNVESGSAQRLRQQIDSVNANILALVNQ